MSRPVKTWPFEGQHLTLPEISERVTAYSHVWIRQALDAGATCIADLHQRHAEKLTRQRLGRKPSPRPNWTIGSGH